MSTESNRETNKPSPTAQPDDLKASDFFPPGTGWNQTEEPQRLHRDDQSGGLNLPPGKNQH